MQTQPLTVEYEPATRLPSMIGELVDKTCWKRSALGLLWTSLNPLRNMGDAAFQMKSAACIEEFRAAGTTILMVSRSIGDVTEMCSRAPWLEHGHVQALGAANDVVADYQRTVA